jgi:Ca2+-transporting ATPase
VPQNNSDTLLTAAAPIGLTQREAEARLARDGHNELPTAPSRNVARIAADVAREPMFVLLLAGAAIYLALGDLSEAWVLVAMVGVVLAITIVQERRTERALDALRDLSSPRALVIRDGQSRRIPGRDVVEGDVMHLGEGDRVPADAVVLETAGMSADESLLTGESAPVRKVAWNGRDMAQRPGGDDLPFVYAGSLVVQGQALARASATGPRSELGKIGRSLVTIESGRTRLEDDTDRLVKRVSIVALVICTLATAVYGATRGDWLGAILGGVATAMSLLPEEFAVVLTVFLALGAWRMSRVGVLTRRIPAIEALGAATVLCVDKTGTLTENRMRVARLRTARGEEWDLRADGDALPEPFHELLEYGQLATRPDPLDPMEVAIADTTRRTLGGTEHVHLDWKLVQEYALTPELLSMSQAWRHPGRDEFVIAAKGAPEAIVDLCHLPAKEAEAVLADVDGLAARGLRVLGVACARLPMRPLPDHQHAFEFRYLGLIGLVDPVRTGVREAVAECRAAGIRVIMITGDLPRTAAAVAGEIGLPQAERVLVGGELDRASDEELEAALHGVHVVARAVPEQKLRIVRALHARGDIVAMTGDGVNDAPALKAADIGVAMGARGSDVAREAAAIVILDDDFRSIVAAVRMGRRIYANLRKAVSYIIAVHLPIAGLALVPMFGGLPIVLLPMHIAFLELIIDPACSIAFEAEPEEEDLMQRPPRPRDASLYSGNALWFGALEGAAVLAFVMAVYFGGMVTGFADDGLRTLCFTTLVLCNLALILASRSHHRSTIAGAFRHNAALGWIVGGTIAALLIVLAIPGLRTLFHLAPLPWRAGGIALGVAVATLAVLAAMRRAIYGRAAAAS